MGEGVRDDAEAMRGPRKGEAVAERGECGEREWGVLGDREEVLTAEPIETVGRVRIMIGML